MPHVPLPTRDASKHLGVPTQVSFFEDSCINHAPTAVEAGKLAQHPDSMQVNSSNRYETIAIRAIEPEYRQIATVESLTERELEVLQLIVDGHSNSSIARKLHISAGTVKTHVRNILRKLCVSDRTQAAIRALRAGLID